jgi:hypothetical protein
MRLWILGAQREWAIAALGQNGSATLSRSDAREVQSGIGNVAVGGDCAKKRQFVLKEEAVVLQVSMFI